MVVIFSCLRVCSWMLFLKHTRLPKTITIGEAHSRNWRRWPSQLWPTTANIQNTARSRSLKIPRALSQGLNFRRLFTANNIPATVDIDDDRLDSLWSMILDSTHE